MTSDQLPVTVSNLFPTLGREEKVTSYQLPVTKFDIIPLLSLSLEDMPKPLMQVGAKHCGDNSIVKAENPYTAMLRPFSTTKVTQEGYFEF